MYGNTFQTFLQYLSCYLSSINVSRHARFDASWFHKRHLTLSGALATNRTLSAPVIAMLAVWWESEVRIFLTAPMLSTEPVAKSFDHALDFASTTTWGFHTQERAWGWTSSKAIVFKNMYDVLWWQLGYSSIEKVSSSSVTFLRVCVQIATSNLTSFETIDVNVPCKMLSW